LYHILFLILSILSSNPRIEAATKQKGKERNERSNERNDQMKETIK
jgi:hypothetical protein